MPDTSSWEPHAPASAGGVTSVGGTAPIASSGGATPTISLTGVVPVANGGTGVATAAQNRVLATPDGSTGAPSFRALVAADLPTVTVAKGGTGVATAAANAFFGGLTSGGAAAPSFRSLVSADMPASVLTASYLFVSPIDLGTGVTFSPIAGDYVWGTSWTALKDTQLVNVSAYTGETTGTLYLKIWVGGVAVASGTVAISGAGVYTLATPFSYTAVAGTTFTASAYADVGVYGIPSFVNTYTNTSYPIPGSPSLMLANPRLYGSGNVEPAATSSNYIFGVEPVIG